MTDQFCSTCIYWMPNASVENVGYCRRYPPQRVAKAQSSYPTTATDSWCGEWKTAATDDANPAVVEAPKVKGATSRNNAAPKE